MFPYTENKFKKCFFKFHKKAALFHFLFQRRSASYGLIPFTTSLKKALNKTEVIKAFFFFKSEETDSTKFCINNIQIAGI